MQYAVEMTSDDMIYIPNFMMIGSGIQVKFLLHQQNERQTNANEADPRRP
jgi:hypothetical protein